MPDNKIISILIVGVGGQGILLASEVLSSVCMAAGNDVKQSEIHGMAQRGGSVSCHIRFGKKVYSPMIESGTADYLVSFEMLEALRWQNYLSENGVAIVNKQKIDPITVASGVEKYPENIEEILYQRFKNPLLVHAVSIAKQTGSIKAVNITLLGTLSKYLGFSTQLWEKAIHKRIPENLLSINLAAFHKGFCAAEECVKNLTKDTTGE